MTYQLFIDDERDPPRHMAQCVVVRSSDAARAHVEEHGLPLFISFDHDLGGSDTAMLFLHWLVDHMLDHQMVFPKGFDYYVHSQNPIGADSIRGLLDNLIRDRGFD